MAKHLYILLGADSPLAPRELHKLEQSTRQTVDVQLIADILREAHEAMRAIGLDPADTTAEELYHALGAHENDPEIFAKTPHVGLNFNGQVVSFNYGDIVKNRRRNFHQRSLSGMRGFLAEEIARRYESADVPKKNVDAAFKNAGIDRAPVAKNASSPTRVSLKPQLLMIGDIFTDAFIKLDEKSSKIIKEKDGVEWLAVPFGQKPAYDRVDIVRSVGPSPNAAVSAARLGCDVSLMAWLGDDEAGEKSLEYLADEDIDTTLVDQAKNTLSNYYYVLRYGADRTILVKNEKYSYTWKTPAKKPDWIYLSLIAKESWPLHEKLAEYLEKNPEIKFALQPGTFHFAWGAKKMAKLYRRAEIVVLNREEAVDVTKKPYEDLQALADGMHDLGPKIVVITDGPHGSYASYDGKMVTIPNYPDPAKPLDRTGAGDAFASTIVSALALGHTMDEALTWAPINSMSVVQKLGAQAGLLTQKEIHNFYLKAPKNYKVTELKSDKKGKK